MGIRSDARTHHRDDVQLAQPEQNPWSRAQPYLMYSVPGIPFRPQLGTFAMQLTFDKDVAA
jgi:hypothetical protein